MTVTGLVEKPPIDEAPSSLAIIGRYVLAPEIFEVLRETAPGRGGEIQLTDALATLVERGEPVHGVVFSGRRYDTGDRLDYLKAVVRLASERDDLGPPLRAFLREFVAGPARRGRVAVLTGPDRGTIGRRAPAATDDRARHGETTVVRMSQDSTGTGFRGYRDTAQVDMPMAPPRRAGAAPGSPAGVRRRARRAGAGAAHADRAAGRRSLQLSEGLAQIRTVERHLDEILAAVPQPDPIELAVLDAQGLLCAEEVVSQRALPAFDQAALDGYAARAEDVAGASLEAPVELAVVGESVAGASAPSSIGPGLALKVAAGAMLPAGADVVVPAVWTDQGTVRVAVHAGPPAGQLRPPHRGRRRARRPRRPGRHADRPGPDQPAGRRRPRARAGAPAAADRRPLRRHRAGRRRHDARRPARSSTSTATPSPRPPGTPARRPTARASCRRTSAASPRCWRASCCAATSCSSPAPSPAAGSTWCRRRSPSSARCASGRSRCIPGPRRASAGWAATTIPVICIPGEPVAALVAFEVFVRPAIRLMLGKRQLFRRTVQAIAGQPLMSPLGYRQYLHGTVMRHPDGGYVVEPVGDGTEALLARMARANCLIVIDEDVTEVAAGGLVTVMPLLLGG